MAIRKIITIVEDLCNGCGDCVTACTEGALQIVDGKAKLVKEQFCDGFGDCIGECPTGALKIEECESEKFDVEATKEHLKETPGEDAVKRMEEANRRHGRPARLCPSRTRAGQGDDSSRSRPGKSSVPQGHDHGHDGHGGCPGSMMRTDLKSGAEKKATSSSGLPGHINESDLNQWPVQIHLVQPGAPFFKDRELVVLSTCLPIASADVHWRFIRGRGVVVGCPKLDDTEQYAEKLSEILKEPTIPKVIVVRMEVPCCGGLTAIVQEAVGLSGRTDLAFEEVTVGLGGDVL